MHLGILILYILDLNSLDDECLVKKKEEKKKRRKKKEKLLVLI